MYRSDTKLNRNRSFKVINYLQFDVMPHFPHIPPPSSLYSSVIPI